jgi:serine/threonine protein kinase
MPCAIILDAPRTGDGVNADALESQHALALRPGVLLADRYRLVRSVRGTSSFAFSYHAEDLSTGEVVVIKEFFPRSLVSREADGLSVRPHSQECERDFLRALHRFALEGAVLAESSHPNLVRVRSVIDANATVYLVMEQHETQPLAEYMKSVGGRIASADAGRLTQDLLSALQVLHTDSIIHRDLSPRTVHVGPDGSARLLEFSARRHLPLHATDLAAGFAAFEQYGMRDIGPWTDVYAVSALLYYMLTGTVPPSALERAAGEALISPSTAAPSLAPGLARLVVKGLALLPQQRPHAVSELRRQLDSALAEGNGVALRNNAGASAPNDLTANDIASAIDDNRADDYDRSAPLRLAAGGIVVPGEERSVRLLRMLGNAASRFRRSMVPSPAAYPELTHTTQPETKFAPPVAEAPRPAVVERPAPFTAQVAAPIASAPAFVAPSLTNASAPSALAREEPSSREFNLAAEIALATDAMQASTVRDANKKRYSIAAATALVLLIGSSLVLLARNGRASGIKTQDQSLAVSPSASGAASSGAASDGRVSVDGGAVLQSAGHVSSPRSEADSPSAKHLPVAPRVTAPTVTPSSAPAPQREAVVPTAKMPNVKVNITGSAPDFKIVPPELLVDSRTRLTNGEDQVEQGEYVIARRTFRGAMAQLDSATAKYPDSQSLKSLRKDLEQADAHAVQACTAENEMHKRRGEQARACQ